MKKKKSDWKIYQFVIIKTLLNKKYKKAQIKKHEIELYNAFKAEFIIHTPKCNQNMYFGYCYFYNLLQKGQTQKQYKRKALIFPKATEKLYRKN